MPALRDLQCRPVFGQDNNLTIVTVTAAIGAAGAYDPTNAANRVPSGFTIANGGAGVFTITFAPMPGGTLLPFVQQSPTPTVFDAVGTASSVTAGTWTVKTFNAAGSPTNPASGDLLGFIIFGLPTGVL